jgi:hypothetical protein
MIIRMAILKNFSVLALVLEGALVTGAGAERRQPVSRRTSAASRLAASPIAMRARRAGVGSGTRWWR